MGDPKRSLAVVRFVATQIHSDASAIRVTHRAAGRNVITPSSNGFDGETSTPYLTSRSSG